MGGGDHCDLLEAAMLHRHVLAVGRPEVVTTRFLHLFTDELADLAGLHMQQVEGLCPSALP